MVEPPKPPKNTISQNPVNPSIGRIGVQTTESLADPSGRVTIATESLADPSGRVAIATESLADPSGKVAIATESLADPSGKVTIAILCRGKARLALAPSQNTQ